MLSMTWITCLQIMVKPHASDLLDQKYTLIIKYIKPISNLKNLICIYVSTLRSLDYA